MPFGGDWFALSPTGAIRSEQAPKAIASAARVACASTRGYYLKTTTHRRNSTSARASELTMHAPWDCLVRAPSYRRRKCSPPYGLPRLAAARRPPLPPAPSTASGIVGDTRAITSLAPPTWLSAERIAADLTLTDMVEPVADALRAYSRGEATSTGLGLRRLSEDGEAHVKTGLWPEQVCSWSRSQRCVRATAGSGTPSPPRRASGPPQRHHEPRRECRPAAIGTARTPATPADAETA
jgi:hypothetical protein